MLSSCLEMLESTVTYTMYGMICVKHWNRRCKHHRDSALDQH